ncbi:sensor histidine kinase RegB [Marivivens donghaensis]|uniref:sensor histidine kinase RegB n=1 Tax=Marivivens donghaensis TaxID=1699413 RepID=UPI00201F921B|nr:ActS/PrrB/RegB family redox-sensitive histidine kinase [Marivivens donghaensis]MCL7409284.1 ActS/PrrB/RegB family redox-sensitive histidine kinase [Marivivens donghaensis]MDN3702762.1 ActS/PrrB/RegB family redox-sensitive histidine kinase [Marivivens donghaensis]
MIPDRQIKHHDRERSSWVRLRTLVILRWIAILGQIIALVVSVRILGLDLEVGLAAMAIGASIIANLFSTFLYPETKRLSELEAMLMLLFDLLQLCLLLYLTGGLNNPFALLVLAPVTIAATFLRLRDTAILGIITILILTALAAWHIPLRSMAGDVLQMPDLFRFGFWVALVIGVVFLGAYARLITSEIHEMSDALLATQMALAREQKLTDLGGVVAAAAHELGTPLATIKLVSGELLDELGDDPDLADDVRLIGEQANRCTAILRSMGRAGKDDLHMRRVPLGGLLREAAEPHLMRGKRLVFVISDETEMPARQPIIERRPEIVHGLRNLVQNAVDFSSDKVLIESTWTDKSVSVRISDDGPGYPSAILARIGDPFMRRREDTSRPGYEGMGLGLFIAKTLLERSGARLDFANGGSLGGALVAVTWNRDQIDPSKGDRAGGLGENLPFGD